MEGAKYRWEIEGVVGGIRKPWMCPNRTWTPLSKKA